MIEDIIRKAMERGTISQIEGYRNFHIDQQRAKRYFSFDEKSSFWYGMIVGSLIANSRIFYLELTKKEPDEEVWNDIWEIVGLHSQEIKDIISKWN